MERDFNFEKANYIGNKRRFAKYIVKKFPKDGKTIFDPTCGCSSVLIEAAKSGYQITGNDLSIVPYWYSKGVFEGAPLSEADIEKLVNARPKDGWLTTEWKGMYPRKREIRRYIDGLVLATKDFSGNKLHTARAIVSRLLQIMYSDSGSGYSTRNWETIPDVKRILGHAIKEVNGLISEIGGKGKITNLDARKMTFPKSDVVYYDPPFFRKDKGHVLYFNSYKVANSVLLQKEWKEEDLKKEEAVDILHRLCKSGGHILISSARNCQVPWAAEVDKFKKTVKKYRITYRQTSGFPAGRDEEQRENLLFAKAKGQTNPYLVMANEDNPPRYVCQHHFRGKSLHADFRIELDEKSLIGWTINSMIEGSIKEAVKTLEEARNLKLSDYSKIDWASGEFAKRKGDGSKPVNVNLLCEMKELEPHSWLTFEGVTKPGDVGATKEYPGVFLIVDKGICEYWAQREGMHEYFPKSDRKQGGFNYRLIVRRMGSEAIEGKSEELLKESENRWLLIKPIDQTPYVLSEGAVKEGWIPPQGVSALPMGIRKRIPEKLRYWMAESEKERISIRDALVNAAREGKASLSSKGE